MRNKLVLAFGSFDILHPGHLLYLKKARSLGNRLFVVVARDKSIEMIKHSKPILNEKARLQIVGSLKMVDKAVLGNQLKDQKDRYNILKRYKPDIIAFGYDQKVNKGEVRQWLKEHGITSRIVSIKVNENAKEFKSSKIKKKIRLNA